jgi:deoxyribodipyrimidine photo-lyase
MVAVDDFGERRLGKYSDLRNNPTLDYVSNLSPWFHFGQVGRRVALEWSLIVVTGVR